MPSHRASPLLCNQYRHIRSLSVAFPTICKPGRKGREETVIGSMCNVCRRHYSGDSFPDLWLTLSSLSTGANLEPLLWRTLSFLVPCDGVAFFFFLCPPRCRDVPFFLSIALKSSSFPRSVVCGGVLALILPTISVVLPRLLPTGVSLPCLKPTVMLRSLLSSCPYNPSLPQAHCPLLPGLQGPSCISGSYLARAALQHVYLPATCVVVLLDQTTRTRNVLVNAPV